MKISHLLQNAALRLLGCSRLQNEKTRIRLIVVIQKSTAQEVPRVSHGYLAQPVKI
jgi:hypothetical protein